MTLRWPDAEEIGIALSDPRRTLALPHRVLEFKKPADGLTEIGNIVSNQQVERIVVGLPLDQRGEVGPMAAEVLAWVEQLKAIVNIPVETMDERMTSNIATMMLRDAGVKAKDQKGRLDPVAATLILDAYLRREATR